MWCVPTTLAAPASYCKAGPVFWKMQLRQRSSERTKWMDYWACGWIEDRRWRNRGRRTAVGAEWKTAADKRGVCGDNESRPEWFRRRAKRWPTRGGSPSCPLHPPSLWPAPALPESRRLVTMAAVTEEAGVGMCRFPSPSPCDIHQKGLAFEHWERRGNKEK